MVYGNAIKNNIANTSAYTSSAPGVNVLQNFIRHDEQPITKPWINENSGINLNTGVAELLWQDQKDLVQSIQLQPDQKYIVFHVSQSTIHEGNAVIALKASASGDIVWSWHIWVYGGDDLKAIKVKNNKAKAPLRPGQDNFYFLSESLGACHDGDLETYPESKVWIKISNGRKTEVIKITRVAGPTTASKYNSSYYQYGRKDPMLPSDGTNANKNKTWYDKTGAHSTALSIGYWASDGSESQAKAEIANTIKNPHTFNTIYSMDNLYYNLWDTNCNEIGGAFITAARFEPVTKSVYDPCPHGFCLPPNGAFTGFTESGNASGNSSDWNVSGSFDKGWNFRTVLKGDPDPVMNHTIFLPASGYRYCTDGVLYFVGVSGYLWSSVLYNMGYGCGLYLGSERVGPLDYGRCSYGFVLCPVKE